MVILFSQKNIICQSLMITDDLKVYSVNEDAVRLLITMSQVRSLPGEPFFLQIKTLSVHQLFVMLAKFPLIRRLLKFFALPTEKVSSHVHFSG